MIGWLHATLFHFPFSIFVAYLHSYTVKRLSRLWIKNRTILNPCQYLNAQCDGARISSLRSRFNLNINMMAHDLVRVSWCIISLAQHSKHDHSAWSDLFQCFCAATKPCEIYTFTSMHASTQSMALFLQQDNMVALTINLFSMTTVKLEHSMIPLFY
jgi:hypothetical protein